MNVGGRCIFDPEPLNQNPPNEASNQNLNNQRNDNLVQDVNYQRNDPLVPKLENLKIGEDVMNQQSTSGLGNK